MRNSRLYWLLIIGIIIILNGITTQASAAQKIKVVTTLSILEDFVRNVGGDRVEIKSLLSGLESEHTYTPKPSDIVAVKEARMLIEVGLGLEVWVDSLIKNASNKNLSVVTTSKGIPLIKGEGIGALKGHIGEPQPRAERGGSEGSGARQGHIEQSEKMESHNHENQLGNPHIWLDPERAKVMIRHITDALLKIDPDGRSIYLSNQAGYFKKIDEVRIKIEKALTPVKNRKIITHHPAWPYFAKRFNLQIVDNIQMQPGTEPSARHVADIIKKIRKGNIRVIVSEPQLNPKVPEAIANETSARIVTLTPIPGGIPGTGTYIDMMHYIGEQLASALR